MPGTKELYDKLYAEKLYTNNYQDFVNKYGSDEGQNELYNKLYSNQLYTNDVTSFKTKYFSDLKKKEAGVSPSAPLAEGGSSESQPMVAPGQPVPSVTKVNKPSAYNKNIEASDWQRHQEITKKIQAAAAKKDSSAVLSAANELKSLRSVYGGSMANDKNLSEDLSITQKIVSRSLPDVDIISATYLPSKKQPMLVPKPLVTAPIPTKERAAQENDLKKFEKSLGSSIDLTEDDLKYMFIKDNVQLGTTAEGQAKEFENKTSVDEAFSDNDGLWNSTKKLYNKFLTSANASLLLPMANIGMASDAKLYLIKSARKFAEEKPDGSATEEEILERAKQMMLEDLNKKSREELIEDWARNGGNDAQKQGIANTLGSVIGKINTKDIEYKKKAKELNSIIDELDTIDSKDASPENVSRIKSLSKRGAILFEDLNENYRYLDNDLSNLSDFKNELDLFKRNYSILTTNAATLNTGILSLAKGAIGLAEMASPNIDMYWGGGLRMTTSEIDNIIKGQLDQVEKAKSMSEIKDVNSFFRISGRTMAEQLPQLYINVYTGGLGPRILAGLAAGQKYDEIKDKEEYTRDQKLLASVGVGLAEFLSEKIEANVLKRALPSARVTAAAANGATRLELDAMKAELKSGIKGNVKSTIDKIGSVTLNANQEGISEVVAQVGGNMVDKYVLNNKKVSLLDGVEDAYLTGAVIGGAITASPVIVSKVISPFIQDPDGRIRNNNNRIKQLTASLEKVTSQESKDIINESINKTKRENEAIINGGIDVISNLTPQEIREGVANYEEIQKIKSQFLVIKGDKNLTDAEKKSAMAPLNTRYDQLVQRRQDIINKANAIQKQGSGQVPVQPETGVGQEVEQGKPQAEPQGVTKEGGQEKVSTIPAGKRLFNEPNPETVEISRAYKEKNGITEPEGAKIESVDVGKSSKIADAYEALQDTPDDPEVQDAYNSMAEETAKQHQDILDAGYEVEIWQGEGEPYANAQEMIDDVKNNKHMYIYSTEQGFGDAPITEEQRKQNKLLQDSGFKDKNGNTLLYNDLFRFVHDFFGHTERGNGFGPVGEENAWDVHARMYTPKARRAMTTETRGQNSWVNFGPQMRDKNGRIIKKGEPGYLSPKDRQFAPQKMGLLPEEFSNIEEGQATVAKEQGAPATTKTKLGKNIKKAIAKVFPDLGVSEFKNAKEMKDYVANKYGQEMAKDFMKDDAARAIFDGTNIVEVLVNEELSDETTMPHEIWHGILSKAFGENEVLFDSFRKSIDKTLRDNGYDDIADELDAFAINPEYIESDTMAGEWLVQFGGMLASAKINPSKMNANQKSLLNQLKDIINRFAKKITGQEVFLEDATPENILEFMTGISDSLSRGEDISGFFKGGEINGGQASTKAQKAAIEILDGPKFDNKLKEDVASYLNGLRDSVIPPNSSREELMERFINNVYEEVGYYLYSKPDARSAGLTWYIEDMVEFSNKIKVVLPELNDENQYKLFLSVLAFTSSGTNPNQNLLYAYNLWNNSKDPKNFDFSKTWAEKKLSFIDKSGKSIASGTIVKETAKDYTVQLIDSLGREEVDKKGNKKQQVIPKKSMKEGYPKPTGYTNRGEIIIGQLEKLEALYEGLGSIENVVNWLQTPQSIVELRKYNESVPDVNGKGPGKTNKEYDPRKNAEGKRNGAFIFGEKIGSFYQNMIGIGETITMDLWWSRTWNRYMGTMINTTSGNNEIQEVPRDDRERNIMRDAVKIVAEDLNLQVSELQAAIWYFEQELWTKAGNKSPSYSYVTAIDDLTKKLKVDEQTRSKLREAEADLSDAEKRRQNASERAAATIVSKGGKTPSSKITTKAQKKSTYTSEEYAKMSRAGVVFHAGTQDILTLDPSKIKGGFRSVYGWGVYFSGTISKASDYGDMITFLNSKALNFIRITNPVTKDLISELSKVKDKNIYYDLFLDKLKGMVGIDINEARLRMGDFIRWDYYELWSKMFLDAGYDGFNQADSEYVVFNMEKANQAILEDPLKFTTKAQKNHPYIPDKVFEKLTTDKDGNIVFNHYSWKEIDEVRPSTGSGSLITSKEEQQALSSVGGLAMYYTQIGQKESHVGNIPNTVVVDPSKVYYMNKDVLNFYDEAKEQFLDHMNRNNNKRVNYAFNPNYQVAWITKVATEKGFDMVIARWRNDYDFRAQTKKTLKPEAEVIPLKQIEDNKISVGDKIFFMGREVVLTDVDDNGVYSYEGSGVSGKIPLEKAMRFGNYGPIYKLSSKPQKARLQKEVAGIIDKSTKRGATKEKSYENALNYLQKSKYYQEADDSERETLVRELRSAMGLKEKRNISVGKILGAIKDIVNITAKESTLLKDQIKLESKAGKAAAKEVNDLRKALSLEVAALAKAGKITTKQAATIIKRLGSINLGNSTIVDRFVDYMVKVFNDAEYSEKVTKANDSIKKIKRFYKGKDVQANVNLMAKNFLTIDPKKLSNIDEYLAISNEVLQAVMPISTTAGVKIRVAADIAKISDYTNSAAKEQAKKVKDDLLSEYQYLIDAGVIDDSMSYDEIMEIVDSINDDASPEVLDKGEDVRNYIVKMFNSLSAIGKDILSRNEDPVTGLPVDLSDDQKAVLKKFLNMDIENMSINEAKLALEYLSNFITNGITDGMAGIVETYSGSENLKTFINTGGKFRNLKLFFSDTVGGAIAEEITTLNILLETALSGQDRSSLFRGLSGFNDIVNGNARARKKAAQKEEEYYEKFKDVKDFFTLENSTEREVLAFLVRTNESEDELERRKGLIEQSIEKMMELDEQQIAQAEIIKEVYDRIGKDAKTIQDVFNAAGKENRDAVNWWINTWSDIYDSLENISLSIYNSTLGKDKNYTPDVHSKIKDKKETGEEKRSAFMMSTKDYTVKKKAGVLIEAKKPSRLGENRVINFNFDTNNLKSYEAALIDIGTADAIRRIDGFLNSKLFSKLGRDEDVDLVKGRINGYIAEIKGMNFVPKSRLDQLNKVLDEIGTTGAAMVLGGIFQIPKQSAGVMVNTFINSGGYLGLKAAFDEAVNNWIDNCGFPIANRSLDSVIAIKTANKYIEEASRSKGGKVIELIKKANKFYLNTFLKNTDTFVARASFMAYYKKELKKKGVDTSNIDWANHKTDKSSAQYAQDMVDRQQNPSDSALMGNLMTSKDPLKQITKKSLFAFMSFTLNQKTRMYSDIISLMSKVSTKKDKLLAGKSLAALSPEMATFSIVSAYLSSQLYDAVLYMMGVDESEEEKEKRRKRRTEQIVTNVAKDFLSPAPLTDAVILSTINKVLDQYNKIYSEDEEGATGFRLFEDRENKLFENWGAAGITITRTFELVELINTAYSGKFEKEYQQGKATTKYLRDNDKKILSQLIILQLGADFGLLPSEASTIVSQAERIAKKRALSEEDNDTRALYKESNAELPDYLK